MPVLSIAALDRFEKIRGTASSGQAFIQMLSTVSAGLVVPFLWFSPLGLSLGMLPTLSLVFWLYPKQNRYVKLRLLIVFFL